MRDEVRRYAPGPFEREALQRHDQRGPPQEARRRQDAPIAPGCGAEIVRLDRLQYRGQPDDRLFIGVFQQGRRKWLIDRRPGGPAKRGNHVGVRAHRAERSQGTAQGRPGERRR